MYANQGGIHQNTMDEIIKLAEERVKQLRKNREELIKTQPVPMDEVTENFEYTEILEKEISRAKQMWEAVQRYTC